MGGIRFETKNKAQGRGIQCLQLISIYCQLDYSYWQNSYCHEIKCELTTILAGPKISFNPLSANIYVFQLEMQSPLDIRG